MKEKIRPIYGELQGLLSEAPTTKDKYRLSNDNKVLWERFDTLVKELVTITEDKSLEQFLLTVQYVHPNEYVAGYSGNFVTVQEYRSKLSALISRLRSTFFNDEQTSTNAAGIIVNQTQNVSVEVTVYLMNEMVKAMGKAETPEEKGFIEKITDGIGTVKSYIDFALLVASAASQYGITPDKIMHLFGH